MKISRKKIIVISSSIAVFILLILFVSLKKKPSDKSETLPAVVIQKPVRQNLDESITITGYVEAKTMIPVVPFVNGTIMEYPAKAGDFVTKDTVLAKIDDQPFRQTMLQAQAAYLASRSTFDRVSSLYRAGAATQQNYDTAKAQFDASKAQYDLANLQVNYTIVKAPVDGTILVANQAVGSIGNTGTPIAILADLTNQVVRLKVPEKYFDLFSLERANLKVKVIRPAEKNMYEDAETSATIENIAPYVSPESKNFEVVCKLDEPGERFRPGMFVKVSVTYRTLEDVPVLPIKTKKLDGSFYLYNPESETVQYVMPEETPSDGDFFIVDEKYSDSYFVIDGQNFVFDGQKVRLYEDVLEEY